MGALVDFPNIATFRKGTWNGTSYGDDYPEQLKKSFEYFSAPDKQTGEPFYVPYISINHDEYPHLAGFQFGMLDAVHVDKDGLFRLDANEVPAEVGELVKSGKLRKPSLEFAEPQYDPSGKLIGGMVGPDGNIYPGPVIKCLTFLGSEVPGVKGLPDIPDPVPSRKLSDKTVRRFAATGLKIARLMENPAMDRQQAIEALKAAGVDCSTLTDAVPDEFIAAILAAVQKMNANAPTPDPDPTTQLNDANGGVGTLATGAAPVAGAAPVGAGVPPSQVLVKFNADIAALTKTVRDLQTQSASVVRNQATIIDGAKEGVIQAFFDRTNGPNGTGQITEAELPGLKRRLMKLDHASVRKFSDSTLAFKGKAAGSGTELEEEIADMERSRPVLRKFNHKVPQKPVAQPGSTGGLSEANRAKLMKGAGVKVPAK